MGTALRPPPLAGSLDRSVSSDEFLSLSTSATADLQLIARNVSAIQRLISLLGSRQDSQRIRNEL